MNFFTLTLITFLGIQIFLTRALPLENDPELTAGYFEGDIVLSPTERNGLINKALRWPKAQVFYAFAMPFGPQHVNQILRGMKQIEEISCIRFYPANVNSSAHINITSKASGCHSSVGYQAKVQELNLQIYPIDEGCFRLGTIVHEFLHALGFYHQQSADDRDYYVKVIIENIEQGKEHNFNKYPKNVVTDFGVPYDYGSVLHYGPKAFSKNQQPTIVPLKSGGEVIGQRNGMSVKDIKKLNLMYNCSKYL